MIKYTPDRCTPRSVRRYMKANVRHNAFKARGPRLWPKSDVVPPPGSVVGSRSLARHGRTRVQELRDQVAIGPLPLATLVTAADGVGPRTLESCCGGGTRYSSADARQGGLGLFGLLSESRFTGQEHGPIEALRKTTVAATDLHGDDDEFANHGEPRAQRGINTGRSHAQPHSSVGANNLEEHGEQVKSAPLDLPSLTDGEDKEAQENVPQVERELPPQVASDIVQSTSIGVVLQVLVVVHAERLFLVNVSSSDRDGDGEDGNVHHDHVQDRHRRMQVCQVDCRETCRPCGSSLKEADDDAILERQPADGFRTEIEDDEEHQVQRVQDDQDPKQPPVGTGGEQKREASTRMFLPQARSLGRNLRKHPDHEPQHDWEASVSNDDEEPHDHEGILRFLKGDHAVWRQGEANIHECHIGREEAPPSSRHARIVNNLAVLVVVKNVWQQAGEYYELKAPKGAVLDATELLALLKRQTNKVGISGDCRRIREVGYILALFSRQNRSNGVQGPRPDRTRGPLLTILVELLLSRVQSAGLSKPQRIERAADGFGIVGDFVCDFASSVPLWLCDCDGGLPITDISRINGGMINPRVHCPRPGEDFLVIMCIINLEPPRPQAPLRVSRPGNAQDFVVLVSLPLHNGNVLGVGPMLRDLQGVLSHAIAPLDGTSKRDCGMAGVAAVFVLPLIELLQWLAVLCSTMVVRSFAQGLQWADLCCAIGLFIRRRGRIALVALGQDAGFGRVVLNVVQEDTIVSDPLRPPIWRHNGDISSIDTLDGHGGPLHVGTSLRLGFGQGRATLAHLPGPSLESLLEPVQPEKHDAGMEGDGVGCHGEEIDHALLESIEQIDVDRIQTGLRVGSAGKQQGIDVRQLALAGGINGNRTDDRCADDPKWAEMKLKCGFLETNEGLIALSCAQI
ncbi:hypothetical protein TOPH_00616 [Tolypocladium ophioglossoides CBS 100239]|uniref:Uncharacterized protein n=1 Tax=Tolypocladium ophioglossoides (strain CBS 100239) TaxID=1163406 RepID=A0A0L0NL50_TOLOC|nr:hypothetical protein TOPH_00616 [Tolypocladium ophioglossoides CBS 100239]